MPQKILLNILTISVLKFALFQNVLAEKIVDFNAESITSTVIKSNSFNLDTSNPVFDTSVSDSYTGPSVYSSFNETVDGNSFWSASTTSNSGLKLRWNPNTGNTGDFASALFLFQRNEFINGFNEAVVRMDADNDSITVKTGYLNLGSSQSGSTIEGATIRIVLKDYFGIIFLQLMKLDPHRLYR